MILSRIISTTIRRGLSIVKLSGFGSRDIREVDRVAPYGIDSRAWSKYKCVYSDTSNDDQRLFIGIIGENETAGEGETVIYSENSKGSRQARIHLYSDGKIEIYNNDQNLKSEIDSLLDGIQAITVPTAWGPSGSPINAATFATIKTNIGELLK